MAKFNLKYSEAEFTTLAIFLENIWRDSCLGGRNASCIPFSGIMSSEWPGCVFHSRSLAIQACSLCIWLCREIQSRHVVPVSKLDLCSGTIVVAQFFLLLMFIFMFLVYFLLWLSQVSFCSCCYFPLRAALSGSLHGIYLPLPFAVWMVGVSLFSLLFFSHWYLLKKCLSLRLC